MDQFLCMPSIVHVSEIGTFLENSGDGAKNSSVKFLILSCWYLTKRFCVSTIGKSIVDVYSC